MELEIKTLKCNVGNYHKLMNSLSFIVIHYVGAVSTAENNAKYFAREIVNASAHFFVDDKEIWNSVPLMACAYHVGDAKSGQSPVNNFNSIAIEMCCFRNSMGELRISEITRTRTMQLVAKLMLDYDIPIQNVVRHYDVSGKICPAPYIDSEIWESFKRGITSLLIVEGIPTETQTIYKTYEDIPLWGKPAIGYFLDCFADPKKLDLTFQDIRLLTIIYRKFGNLNLDV